MRTRNAIRPRKTGIMLVGILLLVLGIVMAACGLMGKSQADYYARKTNLSDGEWIDYATGKTPAPELTEEDYRVGGCTALLDAVGETVEHIEKIQKYIRDEDVPESTMFVITTDGLENASRKYSGKQIKKMIEKKKEEGWKFIFLASNIDVAETADNLGVGAANAVEFEPTADGSRKLFACACKKISDVRAKK